MLSGAVVAVVFAWRSFRAASANSAVPNLPSWPPLDAATIDPVATHAGRWLAPVGGTCPPGHPVKVNDRSGIYHTPGGRFYDRTIPHRCYAATTDAIADGYRAAKT